MSIAAHPLTRFCSSFVLCSTLGACDPGDGPGPDDAPSAEDDADFRLFSVIRTTGSLGYRMNTNHAGGHFFSELDLHGGEHEGTRLTAIVYDEPCGGSTCSTPVLPSSIAVVGGALWAQLDDGRWIAHTDFGQTRWHIETYGPAAMDYELTVEASADPMSGRPTYNFYWDDGWGEGPTSTCLMPGELPELTAAVFTDVDIDETSGDMHEVPGLLTIACTAGASGKATSWGYDPDDLRAVHGSQGLAIYEASVRVVRADYCGDGQSWTYPGTPVQVEDKMGINAAFGGPWLPGQGVPVDEAVWDLDGAVCLDTPRASATTTVAVSCQNGVVVWPCFWGTASAFADPSALFRTITPP